MNQWFVLYCLINNETKIGHIISLIKKDYFYEDLPLKIYLYILELLEKDIKVTKELVISRFPEESENINRNLDVTIDIENYTEYIENLRKEFVNREIKRVGHAIIGRDSIKEEEFINYVTNLLDNISQKESSNTHYIEDISKEFYDAANNDFINDTTLFYHIESLDEFMNGIAQEDYIIIAGRPSMGKSGLLGYLAMSNAAKGVPVLFFSLEMNEKQLVKRMFAAYCGIELWKFKRMKHRTTEDQKKFTEALAEFQKFPYAIDTTSDLTVSKMQSIIQKFILKYGEIGLILIDYVQLMIGNNSKEGNENQILTEISRGLKNTCKKFHVPIIVASQLSRQCELRENKRPMLSDLRNSGCLTSDTLILMSNGEYKTIQELISDKIKYNSILSLNKNFKLEKDKIINIFSTGKKPIFLLKTYSGKNIKATSNHPFLTINGWKSLEELTIKEKIATPRIIPMEKSSTVWDNDKLIFLAHMLGDGCFQKRTGIGYCSNNIEHIKIVEKASKIFNIIPKYEWQKNAKTYQLRFTAKWFPGRYSHNPIVDWLKNNNLLNKYSYEKFIPSSIFSLNEEQIALFLNHLWMTDGSININKNNKIGIGYSSNSSKLILDIQSLLLKLGIISQIYTTEQRIGNKQYKDGYQLNIQNAQEKIKFLLHFNPNLPKGEIAQKALLLLQNVKQDTNIDTIPIQIWDYIKNEIKKKNIPIPYFIRQGKYCPSRKKLLIISNFLKDNYLYQLSTSDILWDRIRSIEYIGEEETFDLTIQNNHNFIANNIIVHNSLEQDADIVIMMYRDHYYNYNPDNERICEALIRKFRNGGVGKVVLDYNLKTQSFKPINPNSALGKIAKRFEYE